MCYLSKKKKGGCTRGPRPTSSLRRGPAQSPWPAPRCPGRRMPFVRGGGGRRIFAQIGSATNVINMTPPLPWLRQLSASFYVSPIDMHHPPHTAHHCRPDTPTPCNSPGWCGCHDRLSSGAAALARRGHGAGLAAKRAQLEGPGPGVPCSYKCWPRELPPAFSNEAPELSLAITTLI